MREETWTFQALFVVCHNLHKIIWLSNQEILASKTLSIRILLASIVMQEL